MVELTSDYRRGEGEGESYVMQRTKISPGASIEAKMVKKPFKTRARLSTNRTRAARARKWG